ncbi:MAG: hypothetical protein V1690_03305 [Candidatus Moraniibacteriota bacterium]
MALTGCWDNRSPIEITQGKGNLTTEDAIDRLEQDYKKDEKIPHPASKTRKARERAGREFDEATRPFESAFMPTDDLCG